MENFSKIPGGAQTASKQENRYPSNYPKQILKGDGCYVLADDGKRYLDFVCSLGPILLGHRYPRVTDAVVKAITEEGTIFSLSHPKEGQLAEMLYEMIPSCDMVRYATNGKDVTEAAVRLSRFMTGKSTILSFSYHGAVDTFMACTEANAGVPEMLKYMISDFDYNDFNEVDKLFMYRDVGTVIMEPHTIRDQTDRDGEGFLDYMRWICDKYGALLIFDEIVTFGRYPGFSAQAYYNIYPDLTCISKGMANGFPISALVGKEKYMKHLKDKEVFFSTTFGGNLVGLSAAIATIEELVEKRVDEHLQAIGERFRNRIKKNPYFTPIGVPWRQFFEYKDNHTRDIFLQELIKEGVFMGVPIFFNYSMKNKDIDFATDAINKVIDRMPQCKLEGTGASEVFKKK